MGNERSIQSEATYLGLRNHGAVEIANREFRSCVFDNCRLDASPGARNRIREVVLRDCRQMACAVAGAAVEDVVVEGLRSDGGMPLFLQDVVFRHVTLRGRISQFKINPSAELGAFPDVTGALAGHRVWYEGVDWALDIREADFTFGPDLQFVPGRLIRFDPATQALVRRSSFDGIDIAELPWEGSDLEIGLEWFLDDSPYDDAVLVAPRKGKGFKRDLRAIEMLRERNLAERE